MAKFVIMMDLLKNKIQPTSRSSVHRVKNTDAQFSLSTLDIATSGLEVDCTQTYDKLGFKNTILKVKTLMKLKTLLKLKTMSLYLKTLSTSKRY